MAKAYAGECIPKATIEEYLDRLEEVIECAPTMPFTGKCVLDRKELQGLLTAMRDAIDPDASYGSTRTFKQVTTGQLLTQRPVDDKQEWSFEENAALNISKASPKLITPEAELQEVVDAKAKAEEIIEAAKQEATRIRSGADEYAENALASIEQNALSAARAARKGLDVLQRRRGQGN